MALASNALTTMAKLRRYMGADVDEIDYLRIYHDGTGSQSAATVAVTATAVVLVDDDAGTSTLTFASNATVSAMVTAIDAVANWVVVQGAEADDALASSDLVVVAAIDALLVANERFLRGADTIFLEDAINSASDDIRRHCGRTNFQSTSYRRRLSGEGTNALVLPDGPITQVEYVSIGAVSAMRLRFTDSTARYATVRIDGTSLIMVSFDGSKTTTTTTLSGNDMTALVVAVNLITNWEAELLGSDSGSWASTELLNFEAVHAKDSWVECEVPDEPESDLIVDKLASVLRRREADAQIFPAGRTRYATPPRMILQPVWPVGLGNIIVRYTAGETVPSQVEKICNALASNIARQSRYESHVLTETVPGYARVQAQQGQGELSQDMMNSLAKFISLAASISFEDV